MIFNRAILIALFALFGLLSVAPSNAAQQDLASSDGTIAVIQMRMMIAPGTAAFMQRAIDSAAKEGAKLLVIEIDTPGGMLQSAEEMKTALFNAPIPVVVYVSPKGSGATSAGVFITLAANVAAMAPGTTIGAAHPVNSDGKDLGEDMRKKAESHTLAMVRSIGEQRGRNIAWAEKAVTESASLTDQEALKQGVIDIVAESVDDLLRQLRGRKVKVGKNEVILEDYSKLLRKSYEMSGKEELINFFANPNILAMLWLGATTGLSLELYNPGAILPGVVGVICLILALLVSQIIPVSQAGVLLLIVGALLIGAEFYITSGILGIGGIIAIVLGSIYLIDVNQAPDMQVALGTIIPVATVLSGFLLLVVLTAIKAVRRKTTTGIEGMVGLTGRAVENISSQGRVFLNGEYWNAVSIEGIVEKGAEVSVTSVRDDLVLEVKRIN